MVPQTARALASGLILTVCAGISMCEAADYAPINCAKAASPTEKTICGNYALGQQEARMATLFQWATSYVAMGQRGAIQDEQKAFLGKRDACKADVACIRNAYAGRITALEAVMAGVREKGPF
jgi:uncharacterized protein